MLVVANVGLFKGESIKYSTIFGVSTFLALFFMVSGLLHASSELPLGETLTVVAVDDTAMPPEKMSAPVETNTGNPQMFEPGDFEDPKVCSTCHRDIYNEWSKSIHANAWEEETSMLAAVLSPTEY